MKHVRTPELDRERKRGTGFDPKALRRIVEHKHIRRVSYEEYREKVHDVYSGPQGALLSMASLLSLHLPLGERLFSQRQIDLTQCREVLDIGSGAGQLATHLIKYAHPQAHITCLYLSHEMLKRARQRLKRDRPQFVVGDLSKLPFEDGAFDCVTCGYVLEHLPEAKPGLAEIGRVMRPGGKLLLLATEDTLAGAMTSRLWTCRTYNRRELYNASQEVGLRWVKELWFTRLHRWLKAGGICVEIEKS